MRNSILKLSIILFVFITNSSQAQSFRQYLENRGLKTLASYAHPTNTFTGGTIDEMTKSYAIVTVYSKDWLTGFEVYTVLKIQRGGINNAIVNNINVLKDSDFVKPFSAMKDLMNLTLEMYRSMGFEKEINETISQIKYKFNSDVNLWSGLDWSILAVNLDRLDYYLNFN